MDIILSNVNGGVSLAPDANAKQQEILASLAAITVVTSEAEQAAAVLATQKALEVVKSVEAAGMEIRRPVRGILDNIMSLEKGFNVPIKVETDRIRGMINAFQQGELLRVAAEETARQEQLRQLQAQQAALTQQADAITAGLPTTTEAAHIGNDAANEALALRDLAEDVAVETLAVAMQDKPAPAKAVGLAVGRVWRWEVTDPAAAYAAHPEFFDLKEKKAVIKGSVHEGFQCPGMRVWQEIDTKIRT